MKPAVASLILAAALSAQAQSAHWRVFATSDGLAEDPCVSVTIGAAGNVFVRHSNETSVSVLDGYQIDRIAAPSTNRARIYESPGGQLWSATPEGLQEFRDERWVFHPVPEIAQHSREHPDGTVSLWLVRQGRVLALLENLFLEINAEQPGHMRTKILRRSDETQIGSFKGMSLAPDGGLWISGERGFAKIPPSLHNFKAETLWAELVPPAGLKIRRLRQLVGDATGVLTSLGESSDSDSPLLVQHVGKQWTASRLQLKGARFAWRAAGRTWVVARDSLFTITDSGAAIGSREVYGCKIFDVAVGPSGAFWLATSKGLFRHAPAIWEMATNPAGMNVARQRVKPPPAPEILGGPWTASLRARNGDLWLGGGNEIAWRHENSWRVFTSTNQIGPEDVVCFTEGPDGRIWCATTNKVWEFDSRNWVPLRSGFSSVNDIHGGRDGTLWVATQSGVYRFARGAWIANGPEDGLPSMAIRQILEDERGRVWAETSTGSALFHPQADVDAPATIARIKGVQQTEFCEGAVVSFAFNARDKWDQALPSRLMFSYRIDDREWSPFQEASEPGFADLAVGKHAFDVRAMDRNGNIEPKPARIEFAIVLPWYRETRLVIILATALTIALFFGGLAFNRHRRLQRAYTEVEKQIAARTRELELASRELLHSQKMNALGSLSAGIAHDFNNILSIIRGSTQLIEENTDNPQKVKTRLDRIKTVVQQGAQIVDAMLGFSRSSDATPAPCDVNNVISDTMKLLGERFLREVTVRFDPARDLPEVSAPKDFIQQILLNFVFNAAEAMSGRKEIALAARPMEKLPPELILKPVPAPSYIMVSVRDSGCGLAPEIRHRIFEPFFTTKALSTRRGTGLGLSMVYELAKKMEAGLDVQSVVGQGSVFSLILPVRTTVISTTTRAHTAVSEEVT